MKLSLYCVSVKKGSFLIPFVSKNALEMQRFYWLKMALPHFQLMESLHFVRDTFFTNAQ